MPRKTHAVWEIQDIPIQITRRRMKHLRIYVYPPDGTVKVSVPYFVSNAEVQEFIYERLDWVKDQREYFQTQPRKPRAQLANGEQVYLWGQAHKLQLLEKTRGHSKVWTQEQILYLSVERDADFQSKLQLLQKLQRKLLQERIPFWLEHWEPQLKVRAQAWGIKKMRTRWGSCNITDARVWFNLELARYPETCLQYVVLHELTHLLEANHSKRFWSIVETHMPQWQAAANHLQTDPSHTELLQTTLDC